MVQNLILTKGVLTPERLEIQESNAPLTEDFKREISNSLIKKIPKYIFEKSTESRTLIIEYALGYNIIKIFYKLDLIFFILIRIEGKIYSSDEIQKISLKVNQHLDINVKFTNLWEIIQEIFIKLETYDFSRPLKARLSSLFLSEEDQALKIEELIPRINKLAGSKEISTLLDLFKFQFLLYSKKRKLGEYDPNLPQLYKKLLELLLRYEEFGLTHHDYASILFNFALILKELKYFEESNDAFLKAADKFRVLKIENLEFFSTFNLVLNLKQMKNLESALKYMLQIEERIYQSDAISSGFKGIFLRHLGELYQLKKDFDSAKSYYTKSLYYFEKEKQVNIDSALNYLALGTINYNEGDYFGASKFFSFAANIFDFLNQDVSEIAKNLGISFLNLSNEYLRTVKVLIFEKDFERLIDLILRGLNYFFLANLHLGNQMKENFSKLSSAYLKILETVKDMKIEAEEQDLAKRVSFILRDHYDQLNKESDTKLIKLISKQNYEKIKEFQPLKIYYFMVIYKNNGVVIFSKTSTTLHELPEMDENLIAGMISAISGFLGEVIKGEQNLSLIDRDNIKIILEYSPNLIGLMFLNKESPQIRNDLKTILSKTEDKYQADFKDWTGEVTKFSEVNDYISKVMK
jgi:tetratricopeptide (TPR) repeat protein